MTEGAGVSLVKRNIQAAAEGAALDAPSPLRGCPAFRHHFPWVGTHG